MAKCVRVYSIVPNTVQLSNTVPSSNEASLSNTVPSSNAASLSNTVPPSTKSKVRIKKLVFGKPSKISGSNPYGSSSDSSDSSDESDDSDPSTKVEKQKIKIVLVPYMSDSDDES